MKEIPDELYSRLEYLGIIDDSGVRGRNFGSSDYNKGHIISPWVIFLDHPDLTFWEEDIIKRILRKKDDDPRELDINKIIHDCQEMLRQINIKKSQKYKCE